ncbi:MAG: DUF4395 family protein [Saccharofermentanales bacterium]
MVQMVKVNRQSVMFCKYIIAGLLWIAVLTLSVIPVYIVLVIMLVSALTGVRNAPLVKFYDITFAKRFHVDEEYINMHSMRFAHIVGVVISSLTLAFFYLQLPVLALSFAILQAVLQTIAGLGYCSAQKLYECVVCNSNCCRFGKGIRKIKGS